MNILRTTLIADSFLYGHIQIEQDFWFDFHLGRVRDLKLSNITSLVLKS